MQGTVQAPNWSQLAPSDRQVAQPLPAVQEAPFLGRPQLGDSNLPAIEEAGGSQDTISQGGVSHDQLYDDLFLNTSSAHPG